MKQFLLKSFVSLLAIGAMLVPATATAATGTGAASLHFSPASGSYTVGSTVTLTITENSSTPVAAVEADLTYPANLLQCNGPASLGAFATSYQNTCSGGSISLAVGVQGTPVSGSQTVGTISFTVIGSGSAALKVVASSEIDDATTANVCDATCAGGASAANYTLAAAATPPSSPTTGSGSTSPTTGGSKTTTSTNTGSKTSAGTGTSATGSTNPGSTAATDTPTTSATSSTKKQSEKKTASKPKHIKSHRTGLVTSSLAALVVVLAGVYWLVIRKRTEVAPAVAAYKLAGSGKSKATAKSKASSKSATTKKSK